jgi:predicted dehydrogenase
MMGHTKINRRRFLQGTVGLAAGLAGIRYNSAWANAYRANDKIRVGIVGLNGMGNTHIGAAKAAPDVDIVALCDVDPDILANRVNQVGSGVTGYLDFREMIDRSDIDAIIIASPTHWHALMATWAMEAGKDVFCEKPHAHNVPESKLMYEFAQYYNRMLQIGTQQRSDTGTLEPVQWVQEGNIGEILNIHCFYYKNRTNIGLVEPYIPTREGNPDFFDMFQGRAPYEPIRRNNVHYDWHWMWETGNGDNANLGIHVLDTAHMFAGFTAPPRRVMSIGRRFKFIDAGETPTAQLTILDYPEYPIILEIRSLGGDETVFGSSSGVVVYCENGYYVGFRGGGTAYDYDHQPIKSFSGNGGSNHQQVFFDAMRSRNPEDLTAPVELITPANTGILVANASLRMGPETDVDTIRAAFADYLLGTERLESMLTYLADREVDLEATPFNMGPWLTFDNENNCVSHVNNDDTNVNEDDPVNIANALICDTYREPYVMPTLPGVIEDGKGKVHLAAACGTYCGACPAYINKHGEGEENFPSEPINDNIDWFVNYMNKLQCDGCLSGGTLAGHCQNCAIRLHAANTQDDSRCTYCEQLPCYRITNLINQGNYPHRQEYLPNLEKIRQMGVEEWIKYEQERWRCPQCGRPISWYDTRCTGCGEPRSEQLFPLPNNKIQSF